MAIDSQLCQMETKKNLRQERKSTCRDSKLSSFLHKSDNNKFVKLKSILNQIITLNLLAQCKPNHPSACLESA